MSVDVVGVGSVVIDQKSTVSSTPKIGEIVLALDYHLHMGGPVANALATLQRLGMKTQYMGRVGDDEYGRRIAETMKAKGIDTSRLGLVEGGATAFSTVLVDAETKQRTIAFFPGNVLGRAAEDCIDAEAVKGAKLLHVDMDTPAVMAACRAANEAGVPISVDADGISRGLEDILRMATIFIPAQEIAAQLTGTDDPLSAGKHIREKYDLDTVVVTRGAEGSVTITQEGTTDVDAFQVEALDTTGAGGVYQGGYLYGYLQGWSAKRTARFANATAGIMVSGMNGWDDIPSLDDVEGFLRQRGLGSDD